MHTRRSFVQAMAGWAAFAQVLKAAPTEESFWRTVKKHFPLEEGLIYLNAANVCPASRPVMDRHLEYLRDFHANPSFQNRDKYVELQERLRAKLAALVRATPDEIAITRNTSEGSNIIVRGIDLKAGDEVVITAHNHPSNNASWKVRAKREGLSVKAVPVPVPARSRDELISGIERAITPRTRVIAITHVTNTAGLMYPAREIAQLARQRGIWMHLDGAQTLGALDVDLRDIGCDSYSASAHKWPMGPLEAGMLYVRAESIPRVWPAIVTAGWSDELKGARKFEVLGQRDDPRIVAFEAAVDFLNLLGMKNVEARMRALATHLKRGLKEIPAVELRTNLEPELSGGVVRFGIRGMPVKKAYDTLWTRHRISAAESGGDAGGIRLCPHVYNSTEELDRAIAAVRELAG